jgi:hypothetical protein
VISAERERRVRLRKYDVDASLAAIGDPGFRAIQSIHAAGARRGRGDRGGIRARLRLGKAERAEDFSVGQTREVFFFLRFASIFEDWKNGERIRDAQRHGHGRVHARDFFEHQDIGNRVRAQASPGFGQQHATAAEFAELAELVGGKFFFAVAHADRRAHFGFHELTNRVSNQSLIVGEGKVHRVAGTSDASTSSRNS